MNIWFRVISELIIPICIAVSIGMWLYLIGQVLVNV